MRFDFSTGNIDVPYKGIAVDVIFNIIGDEDYNTPRKAITEGKVYFVYTMSGNGTIHYDGNTYFARAGSAMFMMPKRDFSYHTTKDEWVFWWFEFIGDIENTEFIYQTEISYPCQRNGTVEDMMAKSLMYAKLGAWQLSTSLFSCAVSILLYEAEQNMHFKKREHNVKEILNYIDKNLCSVTVGDICTVFCIDERTLRNRFMRTLGIAPKQYITRSKLSVVSHMLLSTTYSLEEIAKQAGFSSQYHLSKCFKEHFGMSPGRFRKNVII